MAWAEKLPSGKWRGGYRDSAKHKKYVTNNGQGYVRKTDAKAAAQEAEVEATRQAPTRTGNHKIPASMKFGVWWTMCQEKRPDDTDTDYIEGIIYDLFIGPRWADVPLNKIERIDVQEWLDDDLPAPGRSNRYVRQIYSIFRAKINRAVDKEILQASPCIRIKLPLVKKRAMPYMDSDYIPSFKGKLHPCYARVLEFQQETGLRPGEVCGLHEEKIDRKRRVVVVEDVFVGRKKVIRSIPKDSEAREIPLTTRAEKLLDEALKDRPKRRGCGVTHSDGKPCHSDLVFRTKQDKPLNPRNLRDIVYSAAKRAGIKYKSPYAGRRGFATKVADGGGNVFDLSWAMGHSDLNTLKPYVQQTPAAQGRLRAALGDVQPLEVIEGHGAAGGADLNEQASSTVHPPSDADTA